MSIQKQMLSALMELIRLERHTSLVGLAASLPRPFDTYDTIQSRIRLYQTPLIWPPHHAYAFTMCRSRNTEWSLTANNSC